MLNENDVINKLGDYFESLGHKAQRGNTKRRGFDLVVKKSDGTEICFEVKGGTSSKQTSRNFGQPFLDKHVWSYGGSAIMKTITDMSKPEHAGKKFALGFPDNYRGMMNDIRDVLNKLDIEVYFVRDETVSKL